MTDQPISVIMRPSRYDDEVDRWHSVRTIELQMRARYVRHEVNFSVLFQGPDGECRRVQDGPLLAGPYAPLIPQASAISARRDPNPPRVIETAEGAVVRLICLPADFWGTQGDVAPAQVRIFESVISDRRPLNYPELAEIRELDGQERLQAFCALVGA